jgi:type II restriction/modification system DNA methylase subunit YeeA
MALFQRIDDYTELLMPDDLLSGNSILAYTREAMTPGACEDVEVIGWLYQFYISEKKGDVFDGLKKNRKITPENIPAATQLFTPHWIVRYLVENSLGRLWMLNRPNSGLRKRMEYYIEPENASTAEHKEHSENDNDHSLSSLSSVSSVVGKDFLVVNSPEEIKICDPACGSGHMLTYAFDLLYAIYEEDGYEAAEIPEKILTNNLYGIEIDERAGELAAFALTMKARAKQRRFFSKGIKPNICVLENIHFEGNELPDYMHFVGHDLFTEPLQTTLRQFEEANNFGSLIRPAVTDVADMLKTLASTDVSASLLLSPIHKKVLRALTQSDYLSPKYHVVVANPPYMGGKGMNPRLAAWVKDKYPNSKSDLFAMFIERNLDLARKQGLVAMITMQSWMFLSSFEAVRTRILQQSTMLSMAHLGARAFDSIGGEVVSTTAFVLENANNPDYRGAYLRLVDGTSEAEKDAAIREAVKNPYCGWYYRASAANFSKIPGSPIAYWATNRVLEIFSEFQPLSQIAKPRQGLATSDNDRFLKQWFEVSVLRIGFGCESHAAAEASQRKWFPCQKGGPFRKWYGNYHFVVNWENNGKELLEFAAELYGSPTRTIKNIPFYFREGMTWSTISSSHLSMRYSPKGFISETKGAICFAESHESLLGLLGYCNSKLVNQFLKALSPTLDYHEGPVGRLPVLENLPPTTMETVSKLSARHKEDWDSYEVSWDFNIFPLLNPDYRQSTLKATFQKLRAHWWEMTLEMQRLEEENNRIFIDAYGLQDELTPEVPLNEITLTCNPHYRYGGDKSGDELEALLLADTMRELVSYAVGCMFGRYSLDIPGLVLANQSESLEEYSLRHNELLNWGVPTGEQDDPARLLDVTVDRCSFLPDWDNVIPMLDGDWFTDDIAERFRRFLKVAFGEEHYEENLQFVEQSLNIKGKRNYSIRDYFLSEFYTDHVKRYKKRPIYWLFSSPKGSFNALIYMHRYQPDTVSIVLNNYLREFRTKLAAQKSHLEAVSISASSSQAEKTKALKEIEKLNKVISEMEEYEREVLYPLAIEQLAIDLDDGVKVNYPKFGTALKKIAGLDAREDE